jgi:hypothetical protein
MLVQLLFFPDCPHVDATRRMLHDVLSGSSHRPEVVEVDLTDAGTADELRMWGSPTILVDGADVAGGVPSGCGCRIYQGSTAPGVPPRALVEAALTTSEQGSSSS